MQLTPRARQVLELTYEEARNLENEFVGTEHLLLGLIREGEGLAGRVLKQFNVDIDRARREAAAIQKQETVKVTRKEEIEGKPGMHSSMKGLSLLSISDLSKGQINEILSTAERLKKFEISRQDQLKIMEGRTLAMIFEKPSLRTRVSFEAGMTQLGGHAIYLQPSDIKMGQREPVKDIARTLARMCDCIMARVFKHESVVELARYSRVPVINALSDFEHPCQALADFLTIREHKGRLADLKLAFIGDGNNVAHSLMFMSAKLGTHMFLACPEGYEPDPSVTRSARAMASESGAQIEIVRKPEVAAADADVIYTDVWTSMGQEAENEKRLRDFQGYQINSDLMKVAKQDTIVLHCLPAHRGEEITDEIMESPNSVVFDEAENRLHVQKAVLMLVC